MSTFEFISVLLSIVVGLGLTSLLTGIARVLESRRRIRFYWVQGVWVVNVGLTFVAFWWGTLFTHADSQAWFFPNFVLLLLYVVVGYLAASLILPSDLEKQSDLEAHFFEVRPWFFSLCALVPLAELGDTLLHGGIERLANLGFSYVLFVGTAFVCSVVGARTPNRRFHTAWALAYFVALAVWIRVRHWQIGA